MGKNKSRIGWSLSITLATFAKVCSEVNGRYVSSSVADKNLTNVGLEVGTNQGDNDPKRTGRTGVPTTILKAKH